MLAKDINPFIRRAFILERTPYNKLVKCIDCRVFYILSGSGELTVNGVTIPIFKDHLFIWRGGTEYQWNFSKKEKPNLAVINFDYTQQYSSRVKNLPLLPQGSFDKRKIYKTPDFEDATILNSPVILEHMQLYKKSILTIIEDFSSNQPFSHELAENLLCNLIIRVLNLLSSSDTRTQTKLDPILEYIHQNYDKEITNASLGEIANYHPHYVNLLMKKYTGATLHSYLLDYRMDKAVGLIMNTDLSIEEIAHKTGFKNQSHFCKIFRQKYEITPLEYRKSTKLI